MRVEKRLIFRCDYCKKYLLHKSSMQRHETNCKKNPNNQILCSLCHFSEYLEEEFVFEGTNYKFNFRYCCKQKKKMIPLKASNSAYYVDALKGKYDQIMPTVSIGCSDYINRKTTIALYEKANDKIVKLHDFEGAIEDCNKIIELDPICIQAYLYRGRAKKCLKDYEGTIDDFNKAIELYSHQTVVTFYQNRVTIVDAFFYRGLAKIELQEYLDAIDDFNKAIEIDPFKSYSICIYDYGIKVYELLNDIDSARKMNEKKLLISNKYEEEKPF